MAYALQINQSAVPAAHVPHRLIVLEPRPTATNLYGEPVGAQGFAYAILSWDWMSVTTYQWWTAFIGTGKQSVRLSYVKLAGYNAVASGGYNTWQSGILHKPDIAEDAAQDQYQPSGSFASRINGRVVIRITELGRRFA